MNWTDFIIAEKKGLVVNKDRVDNIQTTSRATLSTAGWYRVAEYVGARETWLLGNNANGCKVTVKTRRSANVSNEFHVIQLMSVYGSQAFKTIASKSEKSTSRIVNKIRYAYDSTKAYIEVYYNTSDSNVCYFEITSPMDESYAWQAITPTLTSETVDGVTVTTTYDIPANASPVTDLDLANKVSRVGIGTTGRFYRVFARMDSTKNNEPETVLISGGGNFSNVDGLWAVCFYARPGSNHAFTVRELIPAKTEVKFGWYADGNYRYFGMYTDYAYSSVPFITKLDGSSGGGVFNAEYGEFYNSATMPTGWAEVTVEKFAVGADLANYLPLTGGKVTGGLQVIAPSTTSSYVRLGNGVREVQFEMSASGEYVLYDRKNALKLISSMSNGTTTFNGTATGNLPLDGGGTVKKNNVKVMGIHNTDALYTLLDFIGKDTNLGSLGFDGVDNPVFRPTGGSAEQILHTGNSAKVAIQSTAPTDTTALWVY